MNEIVKREKDAMEEYLNDLSRTIPNREIKEHHVKKAQEWQELMIKGSSRR